MGLMSSLFGRRYLAFLALLDEKGGHLWSASRWSGEVLPSLMLLEKYWTEGSPSIHVRQTDKRGKPVPGGPYALDGKCVGNWAQPKDDANSRVFIDLQVFYPKKAALQNKDPELYLQMASLKFEERQAASYSQYVLLLSNPKWRGTVDGGVSSVEARIRSLSGVRACYRASLGMRTLNSLESVFRETFLYRGILDIALPELEKLPHRWEAL